MLAKIIPETKPSTKGFEGIQALRFIAAISVVLTHATLYASERLSPSFGVWTTGAQGVDIFFVISGFVMYVSTKRIVTTPVGWRLFAHHRLNRIVPLYWAATFVKYAIMLVAPGAVLHSKPSISLLLFSLFFIPAINPLGKIEPVLGVGWTLNYEMFFYLIFCVAIAFRFNRVLFSGLTLGLVVLTANYTAKISPIWAEFYSNSIIIEFFLGTVLGFLVSRYRVGPAFCIMAIVIGFAWLCVVPVYNPSLSYLRFLNSGLAAVLVVGGVAFGEGWLRPHIPGWLIYLGASSYALYLVHPLISPIVPVMLNSWHVKSVLLSVMGSLSCAIVASVLVYRYFEGPVALLLKNGGETRRVNPTANRRSE